MFPEGVENMPKPISSSLAKLRIYPVFLAVLFGAPAGCAT